LPPIPRFIFENNQKYEFGSWFKSFSNLGAEIYHEAISESEMARYIVITVPTKEYVLSAICHGIIDSHITHNYTNSPSTSINGDQIKVGMKISGKRPGNNGEMIDFIAVVTRIEQHPEHGTLIVLSANKNRDHKLIINRLKNIKILDEKAKDLIGILNLDKSKANSYWETSQTRLDLSDFQKPIIGIRGTRELIEEELTKSIGWSIDGEEFEAHLRDVVCPLRENTNPPFFASIQANSPNDFAFQDDKSQVCEILTSFNAIKGHLKNTGQGIKVILIGRNERNIKATTEIIADRYKQSSKYELPLKSVQELNAIEVLSYGQRK
jgi:hypothetical protein